MTKSKPNPKVEHCFKNAKLWRRELEALRSIILACGLVEELKWGKPVYSYEGSNVVFIWGFKAQCAIGFGKGVLLKDPKKILLKIGENTQAGRKIAFTDVGQIKKLEPVLKAYIKEAIAVEKTGLEVTYKKTSEFAMPQELRDKMDADTEFKKAFTALTPGRQRGYLLIFSGAKQSATRAARIEKWAPQILKGRGMHDH